MAINPRVIARQQWLQHLLGDDVEIQPLAGDASFRCYFRIHYGQQHDVLMDAPPEHEDVRPFLAVRAWFERAGLRVSTLKAENQSSGFLLLEDFGNESWASFCAAGGNMKPLFEDALRQLQLLQASQPRMDLPVFDIARMRRECDLYLDWYLPNVAGKTADHAERQAFHGGLHAILQQLEVLPRVPVHLDYHSRNLMLPESGLPLGQIDYQDAVMGPVTYDLASLLYDCYQDYPEDERLHWSKQFFKSLSAEHAAYFSDARHWHHCLRLTALQRHIKAIGIFSRLAHRDGKTQFLNEIPLTQKHLREEMAALAITADAVPLLFI
ncbi:phosphotransferase [Mariprofundus ferrooxydans]|nr:phosphotransferase [Mariprofundus ferrooxydans]